MRLSDQSYTVVLPVTITSIIPIIYPNPVEGNKTLFLRNATPNSIFELYDVSGNLIHPEKVQSENESFEINLSTGYYIFFVKCDNGFIHQAKLMEKMTLR